jgi:putative transposase
VKRYEFIFEWKAVWSLQSLCRVLEVSRSGWYDWMRGKTSARRERLKRFDLKVKAAFDTSYRRYGSRRLVVELIAEGIGPSRSTVVRSLQRQGLQARRRRKFVVTTDSRHEDPIAPNLLNRDFAPQGPNLVWAGDITYIPTAEGWLYLAVLIDLWSRRIVGFAMSDHIDRQLVMDAFRDAVGQRNPPRGLMHHTDRGSQYTSSDYQEMLDDAGVVSSMSRKGNCWDNAPTESVFSTIKTELRIEQPFASRDEARDEVFRYIVWYNRHRRHSFLNYLSPAAFEQNNLLEMAAA